MKEKEEKQEAKRKRLLDKSEIEVRVSQIAKDFKWVNVLLYKDARCDMRILDELYGIDGWQRTHEVIDGRLYCTISIWSERLNQWVKKQDVGTESQTEKEKGQASDAFKRAGFNVGIGRELYTAPNIKIYTESSDMYNGKVTQRFYVSGIEYNKNREISYLEIKDSNHKVRYNYDAKNQPKGRPRDFEKDDDNTEYTDIPPKELETLGLALQEISECNTDKELDDCGRRWKDKLDKKVVRRFLEAGSKRRTQIKEAGK